MGNIVEPTKVQLDDLVAPYLTTQPSGLGFAIGYASPSFAPPYGSLYFKGNYQNQFPNNVPLAVSETTPFEIASISKTFTATLYAAFDPRLQSRENGWRLWLDQSIARRYYARPTDELPVRSAAG